MDILERRTKGKPTTGRKRQQMMSGIMVIKHLE